MTKRPIDYRDHRLVIAVLGVLYEADEDVDPFDLKMMFAGDQWKPDTVERTIGDLVNMGALRRMTPSRGNPRARKLLRMTELGRAWVDRRLEPYVPHRADDDEAPIHEDDEPEDDDTLD